ncbi:MAG: efflux RND transporter periplasmic adaptor subunit [Deltaproteobacteria bacterium]|nr:efflux RND transporter periplasmic adaptor subunit [Deltaproteobacteria bacterium]
MPSSRRRWIWRIGLGLLLLLPLVLLLPRWLFGPKLPAYVAQRSLLIQTVAATGRVRPAGRLPLASVQIGAIRRAACKEGARVEAGAVLFELSDEAQRANLAEAQAAATQAEVRLEDAAGPGRKADLQLLRRAELALADAEDKLSRLEQLWATKAVAEAQVADARRARDIAASQLESARTNALGSDARGSRLRVLRAERERVQAAVAAARALLEETRIVAPRAGILATCEVEVGEVVNAGQALAVLVSDGPLEIVIEPDEKNLSRLALGQEAKVVADAFPDQPFDARVTTVVGAVDPVRGTIEVRLLATPPPPWLVPDMTVSVEIESARHPDALTVPREAVRRTGEGPWLFVHKEGRAEKRELRLGLIGQETIEVLGGLEVGEVVLLPGPLALEAGTRVRAVRGAR